MSASISVIQKRFEKLDPSDDKYRPLLRELLSHQDLRLYAQGLHDTSLEGFIELLDEALSNIPVTDDLFRKTLRRLQSICGNRGVLPRSYVILNERLSNKGQAIASGDFADAHEAKLDGKQVCIKTFRSYVQDTGGVTKKIFYREVVAWKRLRHPNIVPFLGVPAKIPPFEIVCAWMENDRITEYVRRNPGVDRIGLLWDVADGLHYLHSCNIIHGDLKGANILIDGEGHARLTDFGLTSIIRGETSVFSPHDPSAVNTTTWAAPEILGGGPASKEGDVFTFAMVTVETFTGGPPFVINFHAAILEILNGKRPQRPATLRHDGLWEIMNRCWSQEPEKRLTTSQLLDFFRTSFPGKRDTPEAHPPLNSPSTWTLVVAEGDADRNPESHPGPSRQDTLGDDLPPFPVSVVGPKVYPRTPAEGPPSGIPPSQIWKGQPVSSGQTVSDPCVDAAADTPIFTSGPHVSSPNFLKRLGKARRTLTAAMGFAVRGIRGRDTRTPTQQVEHTHDAKTRRRKPVLRALPSFCCCF